MQNNPDIDRFLSELEIKESLNVEEDLGNGYVRLKISEAERRQALQDINSVEDVVVELLRNSRDAGSKNIFIGTKKIEDKKRIINIIDDGIGIPRDLQNLIFESRVTSKLENGKKDYYGFHGRGMALFSLKLNVEDIKLSFSGKSSGASFYIVIDLTKLPEKKDQSLMPHIIKNDEDTEVTGGVNNIIKTIIDFQFQNHQIDFYYGSPIQILATMRESAIRNHKSGTIHKFDEWEKLKDFIDVSKVKVTEIPALTDNFNLLEEISLNIFEMNISKRGIQRIIYNEVNPLNPLKIDLNIGTGMEDTGSLEDDGGSQIGPAKKKERKLILYDESRLASRFKDEEIRCIISTIEQKIEELGSKYFITADKNIELKKSNNALNIIIELKQKD